MITTTTKYAVNALTRLSKAPKGAYVGIDSLAEEIDVPRAYLAKIMKKLAYSGIVLSKKGLHGGFRLPAVNKHLSLYDICLTLDDPVTKKSCFLEDNSYEKTHNCGMRNRWITLNREITQFLKDFKVG